jgi:hypothetical protein
MYGMHKTTVYLPPDVRLALKQTAVRRHCSEAEVIRQAILAFAKNGAPARPRVPLFRSRKPRVAERVDELLAGFGRR